MGKLSDMDPIEIAGELYDRAREVAQVALDERFAAKVVARQALFGELSLHDVLRRDPRVIHAGEPERAEPLHPLAPDDRVLDRVIERVPDVQRPGDVRRREHDAEGVPVARGREETSFFPLAVEAVLHRVRVVALRKLLGHRFLP